ncbi:MAG: DUF188 domain-containing protein [Acidobacteriota bacterium]
MLVDAADDWIVEGIQPNDVVVTADIPLAQRCLENGAAALVPKRKSFTEENVGDAVATRDLPAELRSAGTQTSGPALLVKKDRSRFLQELDRVIRAHQRSAASRP